MANYRTITGQFKNFLTDTPYQFGEVIIRLIQNTYTIEAGFPAYNQTVGLDATGHLPVGLKLWCNGDGLVQAEYEITEPDGKKFSFYLNYDDGSPISIQALRAGGSVPENPSTVNSLIDDALTEKAVRADIEQTFSTEEKNRIKTALEITPGSETAATLGSLINGATAKTTPVDADKFGLMDSAASNILKKLSWANLKAAIKSYIETAAATFSNKTLTSPKINVGSDATGDLYYRDNAGNFIRLPIGTDGQTLTANDGVPIWDDAPAGGGSAESPLTLTANNSAETPLTIEQSASQSAAPIVVKDSSGNVYLLIEASSYQKGLRIRGGYDANGVVLNESGLRLLDTGTGGFLQIDTNPSNLGPLITTNRSKITFNKGIYIADASGFSSAGSLGVVFQSPDGTFWKKTVDDNGDFVTEQL